MGGGRVGPPEPRGQIGNLLTVVAEELDELGVYILDGALDARPENGDRRCIQGSLKLLFPVDERFFDHLSGRYVSPRGVEILLAAHGYKGEGYVGPEQLPSKIAENPLEAGAAVHHGRLYQSSRSGPR